MLQRELELIGSTQSPSLDPALAKCGGKLCREPVNGKNAFGVHFLDEFKQVVVTGMIGDRECCITTIAVAGAFIDGPSG